MYRVSTSETVQRRGGRNAPITERTGVILRIWSYAAEDAISVEARARESLRARCRDAMPDPNSRPDRPRPGRRIRQGMGCLPGKKHAVNLVEKYRALDTNAPAS